MAEDDCQIEYLDEDADIVQQCVQTVEPGHVPPPAQPTPVRMEMKIPVPVLVERRPVGRPRKKRKAEEDSDYEPFKYLPPKNKKKKTTPKYVRNTLKKYESYRPSGLEYGHYGPRKSKKLQMVKNDTLSRKELDIRVPDYDDPLCLPVRAIKRDQTDSDRLNTWNNLCLEHFERSDTVLKPDTGETVASKRTIVLRNVTNKRTGKLETTVWSGISVENDKKEKKSEVVQCVLPKYREKKVLNYKIVESKRKKSYHHIDEVIITKEDQNDGERLIVYKPKETMSLMYKLFEDGNEREDDDDEHRPYMKEVASCRVCAPCYQMSWRGFRTNDAKIRCEICSKICRDVSSLLIHLKSHSFEDMNKYKRIVSRALSQVVEYHYKCRICQQKYPGIKELRKHVQEHRGTESFICDIGSHVAT